MCSAEARARAALEKAVASRDPGSLQEAGRSRACIRDVVQGLLHE